MMNLSTSETELKCYEAFFHPHHYCFPISGTTCCATRLNFASNLVLLVVNCDLCQVFELLEELTKKGGFDA